MLALSSSLGSARQVLKSDEQSNQSWEAWNNRHRSTYGTHYIKLQNTSAGGKDREKQTYES